METSNRYYWPTANEWRGRTIRPSGEGGWGCGIVQSGTTQSGGPEQESMLCFSKDIAIVDGDSSYNLRHGKGLFDGDCYPAGALDDFMPQSDVKLESIGLKQRRHSRECSLDTTSLLVVYEAATT